MLCQGCLHLAKTAVTVGIDGTGFLPLHLTMADLDIAVQEKCYTCARLRIQFDDETVQKLDKNALFQGRAIEGLSTENEFGLLIPYEPKFGRDPELPSGSGYSVVPLPDEQWTREHVHNPGPSTGSLNALNLTTAWLWNCQRDHELCSQGRPPSRTLPSRVMDLSCPALPSGYWRLVLSENDKTEYEPYMTLSHRWGTSQPLTLTEASMMTLRTGSRIADLPGLYQDAVAVAKHLSVRYLWIDSLCIFQDSQADFEIEAASMQKVYAEAMCNLAACTGVSGSMFVNRDPEVVGTSAATVRRSQSGLDKDYVVVERGLWSTEVINTPLSRRAWVFQEELLARKTLYFGPTQISWSCRSGYACETFPVVASDPGTGGLINRDKIDRRAQIRDLLYRALRDLDLESAPGMAPQNMTDYFNGAYNTWGECVESYTARELTHVTDKLPALSGIARLFGTHLKDQYVAGLWRRTLPKGLMWGHSENARTVRRASTYQAPSWSWASMNGPIETGTVKAYVSTSSLQGHDELSTVVDIDVELAGDEYGSVVSGSLSIRGPVLPLRRDDRGWYFDFEGWERASLQSAMAVATKPPHKKDGARKRRGVVSKKYGQRHGTAEANIYTPPPTELPIRKTFAITVKPDIEYISIPEIERISPSWAEYVRRLESEPSLFALFLHSKAIRQPPSGWATSKEISWRLHPGGLILRPAPPGAAAASTTVYERAGRFEVQESSAPSLKPWWLPASWDIFREPTDDTPERSSEANATGASHAGSSTASHGVKAGKWVKVGKDMMTVCIV